MADDRSTGRRWTISMLLRFVAFAFLLVGFLGLTASDAWLEPATSPFGPVFLAGILAAIASIYLGIYRHDPTDRS